MSVSPLKKAVSAKEGRGFGGDRRLEEACLETVFAQHFLPCPAWFTPENLQVPPATVAAVPTLGLLEASKRPGATSVSRTSSLPSYRLPLPFLNAQSPHPRPSAPCLAVCTVCIALRKEGTAGVRRRGWKEGKLSTDPPSPTSLSLLPSKRGKGVVFAWEVFLPVPQPDVLGGAGASGRASL